MSGLHEGVVVVQVVVAVAMVGVSAGLLRGLRLPDFHHCLQWSEEAHTLSPSVLEG